MTSATEYKKVLLIDLENCPSQLEQLPDDLVHYLQVVICYATSHSKLPLNWLVPLSTAISENKLKIIKMACVSKNSADFGICFLAGALMQEMPKETHFVIVSNDKDLDHVVHLLKSHDRSAERIGSRKEEPIIESLQNVLPQSASPQASQPIPVAVYCAYLIAHRKNRPAKVDTLLNSIKANFKDQPSVVNPVYQMLISSGCVKVAVKRVTYNDKKIQEIAGQ